MNEPNSRDFSEMEPTGATQPGQMSQPRPVPPVADRPTQATKGPITERHDRLAAFTEQRPWLVPSALVVLGVVGVLLIGISTTAGTVSPTPAPSPSAQLSSEEAGPGDIIVVTGTGWQPGDSVLVRLVGVLDGQEIEAGLAFVTVAENGDLTAPFIFPSEARWAGLTRVLVSVQSTTTGDEVFVPLRVSPTSQTPTLTPTVVYLTPTLTLVATVTPIPSATPMPFVQPTATPTPVEGWRGEYYDNRNLAGGPVLVRTDGTLNFDWGTVAPVAGVPADGFSARWTRTLNFRDGTYRFSARSDDGVRVWLDGELIIDQWHDASSVTYTAERKLSAGAHTLRVEYYESAGAAKIQFWWERVGDFPQWRGEYFSNVDLTGRSALIRNDPTITFDWGRYAPDAALPADNFSIRWTRILPFEQGRYRFHAWVDDGVRLYVDDALVLDEWQDGGRRDITADHTLSAGNHSLRVEYYERTGDALIHVWWEQPASYPDWRGEYWANRGLEGSPVLVRNDVSVNFNWAWSSPATEVPADNFSARWTRALEFDAATYRFHVLMDDGARLWVDEQLIIDDWHDGAPRERTAEYALAQGTHSLRLEFYEHTGSAQVHVWWEEIPSPSYPDWRGEYWPNRNLSGNPALVRNDKTVEFYWGTGAAAVGLPADNFSAHWYRQVTFDPGVYRFYAQADDGVRLYIDGNLVLDEWRISNGQEIYRAELALAGEHQLDVMYYELSGNSLVKFWWERVSDLPTVTPTPTPGPTLTQTVTPTLTRTPTPESTIESTPTPTPTWTPTPTREPTQEPTTVQTLTRTPEHMETPMVTPTMAQTLEPPTASPTFEPMPKPTLTSTSEPLLTPTPTPMVSSTGVRLNEVMPVTGTVGMSSTLDAPDEWIELYNPSSSAVDLTNWSLDDAEGGSAPYRIPEGTMLQPGTFVLFFGQTTGIILDDTGDEVRLIAPDGVVTDMVAFGPLLPTSSYSRDDSGAWHDDWTPSPGAPNLPPALEQTAPPATTLEEPRHLEKRESLRRELIVGKQKR